MELILTQLRAWLCNGTKIPAGDKRHIRSRKSKARTKDELEMLLRDSVYAKTSANTMLWRLNF